MDIPCNKFDLDLFHASTIVTVGNGKKAKFWHSSWVGTKKHRAIPFHEIKEEELFCAKSTPK
jgi:collagenase-like PrtC family protease